MGLLRGKCFTVCHIYRQRNAPADFLACLASEDGAATLSWNLLDSVPPLLKELLRTDKSVLPYIRQC